MLYDPPMVGRPKGYRLSPKAFEDILRLTGLSLTEVAKRAGIPRSSLSSLAGGHHAASIIICHRIARVLGVHAVTLFPALDQETP